MGRRPVHGTTTARAVVTVVAVVVVVVAVVAGIVVVVVVGVVVAVSGVSFSQKYLFIRIGREGDDTEKGVGLENVRIRLCLYWFRFVDVLPPSNINKRDNKG